MHRLSHSGLSAIERCPYRLILQIKHQGHADYSAFNLHKLNTIPGTAIHQAIEEFLNIWKDDSSISPQVSELFERATSIINSIWKDRQNLILEYIHSIELEEGRNFHSEQLRTVRGMCMRFCRIWNDNGFQDMDYVSHEKRDSHQFGEDIELIGEIDLLVKDEQGIYYVLDWKSGLPPRTPLGRSQLGIYGFLTHSVHDVPYANIRCAFVSLKEGSCVIREFREQRDLKLLNNRLDRVIETLNSYDTGQYQDYEWAVPTEQNCIGCPYSHKCEFRFIPEPHSQVTPEPADALH